MASTSRKEDALESENAGLRDLLDQAEVSAARLLAKAGIDAIENDAAKRLQRLLLEELHHRVKNMLATVLAITSQSLRTADTLDQARLAVESRMMALGRAHDMLLQVNWSNAPLADVIRAAIEPFDSRDASRFSVQDIAFEVSAGAVLPLTMSLNELCTNAVKYGALSSTEGRIEIAVSIDEQAQRIRLTWTESGGPHARAPIRGGFGTRLINRLAEQLSGEVRMNYQASGLVCEIDMPLAALQAQRAV
jgi:two-component sensor histidine kinase